MRAGSLRLSLLVPGLLGPVAGMNSGAGVAEAHGPALRVLLARARRTVVPTDTDALRYRLLGYALSDTQDHPDAWLSYQFDTGAVAPGALLRADPVHLRADRSHLLLFDAAHLHITPDETQALAEAFNRHYAADGLRLELPVSTRGYLHLPQLPELRTTPLMQAVGCDVDACLPAGHDAREWHRFLNEVQMLFHDHPVNRAREARGKPVINSLWLWGGGRPLAAAASDWQRVWSDDPALRGLAWLNGIRGSEPPADAQMWLNEVVDGQHLLHVETLRQAVAYGDVEGWSAEVERLERTWFAPLLQALRRGRLRELTLYPGDAHVYRVMRRDLWCFWRVRIM